MDDQNNATSGKHERSSASNAPNDKRQKMTSPSCPATPYQNEGVLAVMNKLTLLVEHHPEFLSKLEGLLEEVFNKLEPEVSAAIRKEKNEDSCPIFKLSNDELKLVFGYAGEKKYGFVACVSNMVPSRISQHVRKRNMYKHKKRCSFAVSRCTLP